MKRYYANFWLLVAVFGGALLPYAPAQAQTQTEQTRQITVIHDLAPIGVSDGQTLRISVFNPLVPAAPGEDGRKFKMLFAPVILDVDGRVLARRDEITLDPGEFHSFDFKRVDLPLAGEPGTGRLQVRGEVRRRFFNGIAARIPQGSLDKLPIVLEVLDSTSGKTINYWVFGTELPPTS